MDKKELEEGLNLMIDFKKIRNTCRKTNENVIPVVAQDVDTKEILVIAYVNKEALYYAIANRVAAFWSTSRNELWVKGMTSGNILELSEVRVNCEQNSLLYLVRIKANGGACHTKDVKGRYRKSCYYRKLIFNGKNLLPVKKKGEKNA